jgi:type II secretion system protein H
MLSYYVKHRGFTLVELLVVMVILGLTSSLVAPDMFAIVKRSQANTELAKIKAITELSIERSFFAGNQVSITFKDNTVVFSQLDGSTVAKHKVLKTVTSEFFTFEDTVIRINKGKWQGKRLVALTKSPENKLTDFRLHTDNGKRYAVENESADVARIDANVSDDEAVN